MEVVVILDCLENKRKLCMGSAQVQGFGGLFFFSSNFDTQLVESTDREPMDIES
jgi:hypothetical protein